MIDAVQCEPLDANSLASLSSLLSAVAASADPQAILATTMSFLRRWHPQRARILTVHAGTQLGQLLAEWQDGQPQVSIARSGKLRPLADFPLLAAWDGRFAAPLFLADIAGDSHLGDGLRGQLLAAGHQARSSSRCTWKGMVAGRVS